MKILVDRFLAVEKEKRVNEQRQVTDERYVECSNVLKSLWRHSKEIGEVYLRHVLATALKPPNSLLCGLCMSIILSLGSGRV